MTPLPCIRPSDERPIYQQILEQIAGAIAGSQLLPGEELTAPSELAEELAVSPLAVRKAYERLEERGLCAHSEDETYRVSAARLAGGPLRAHGLDGALVDNEQLIRQLERAAEVQKRLLPPVAVEDESFTIAARSQPAGFVSGDFYDVIRFADGAVGVVVGDVAGKGLSASLVMAAVKTMMPFMAARHGVEETLCALNTRVHREFGRRVFVALAYARLDPHGGCLELANAGLPDPLLFLPGARPEAVPVAGPRLPLGVRQETGYRARVLRCAAGSRLLLYSDGVPEAATDRGEPLGYEAFQQIAETAASAAAGKPLGRWLDGLLAEVARRVSAPRSDDWTTLVLEVLHDGSGMARRDPLPREPACAS